MIAVELNGITTGYRSGNEERVVSKDLNVCLHSGELTCMIGPNGAGKSTLLRTIARFQPALQGEVLLHGKKSDAYTADEMAKEVSVVLTDNSHIHDLTAFEVVAMGRMPYTGFWGRLSDADEKIVNQCIEWVGAENVAERNFQTLSDGERQRVMIAKAIAQQTPIVLLDEPTAFLYYPNKVAMMLLLRRLAHEMNKCILMSVHDIDLALQVADGILFMNADGNVISGRPADLSSDGTIERLVSSDNIGFDRGKRSFFVVDK